MTARIICVGNRFVDGDDTGPQVYDRLSHMALPPDVDIVDGGLLGLNLLRFAEGADRLVFVDSVSGFGREGEVLVLDAMEAADGMAASYGHSCGLAYLLRVLPEVCEGGMPQVLLVGVEGSATEPMISRAADLSIKLAEGEKGL